MNSGIQTSTLFPYSTLFLSFLLFIALFVIVLGLISSIITAIIAAIILVSVLSVLQLEKKTERSIVIIACFAIGMGAALTPIGEPLSTIVTGNLNEEFFYLFKLLGIYIDRKSVV